MDWGIIMKPMLRRFFHDKAALERKISDLITLDKVGFLQSHFLVGGNRVKDLSDEVYWLLRYDVPGGIKNPRARARAKTREWT
jgi:hypothetical protein